jgi:class I fructose-bisphosphate aldolase
MGLGKQIRLSRLFGHSSGNLSSVAADHWLGYHEKLVDGLKDMPKTIAAVVAGKPDAVTLHRGAAQSCWGPHAGKVPLIIQSIAARPDDSADEATATPEDAVRLGADAFATCAFIRGKSEAAHLRRVADQVREAARFDIPVILHIYPRKVNDNRSVEIVYDAETIEWAVHCCIEVGVDVVKVPFTGDVKSYADIIKACPLPVVAAGGPKANTLREALDMASKVMQAGAKGMTVGRNIWGFPEVTKSVEAFKAVIHDGMTAEQAMKHAGIKA